jgi:nonribosomal peptide synthetase DhbF
MKTNPTAISDDTNHPATALLTPENESPDCGRAPLFESAARPDRPQCINDCASATVAALQLDKSERHRILCEWNQTAHNWPDDCNLHEPFERQANQLPEALAVVCGQKRINYGELNRFADVLAEKLIGCGLKPSEVVGITTVRSIESIIAMLGVLKAGGAYLPLDTSMPVERIGFTLADANLRFVVGQLPSACVEQHKEIVLIHVEAAASESRCKTDPKLHAVLRARRPSPSSLAYVIYTSGSTGKPKGVMIQHCGAVNTVRDINQRFAVSGKDRVLALSSFGFDLSVYDVFGVLAAGGAIVLPTELEARDPAAWLRLMKSQRVTLWNSVPALMELLATHLECRPATVVDALRLVLLSGDWISVILPQRIQRFAPQARIISLGGATEASIWSIAFPIESVTRSWKSIPYGRPLLNQKFHILDEQREPCPVGVPGELYIGGRGVAMGYLNRPQLTAERFVPDPFSLRSNATLYRTGDLGRYLPDGNIEFLGRSDTQVKIHGYRIELGEIEAALVRHPRIREVAVAAHNDDGLAQLVAYVVPVSGQRWKLEELRSFLAVTLPYYMLPTAMVALKSLPRTSNGKIDRRNLPRPRRKAARRRRAVPRTTTEAILVTAVAETLRLDEVGINDDFLSLGGDSLQAVGVAMRIQEELGVGLQSSTLIAEKLTLAELAASIDRLLDERASCSFAEPCTLKHKSLTEAPLSFPQQQLLTVSMLQEDRATYNVPLAYRIEGDLDVESLSKALAQLAQRHDILRTTYGTGADGRLQQRIHADLLPHYTSLRSDSRQLFARMLASLR